MTASPIMSEGCCLLKCRKQYKSEEEMLHTCSLFSVNGHGQKDQYFITEPSLA